MMCGKKSEIFFFPFCPQKSSKAESILQQVFSHLNVVEVEFFGLRFCDVKQQTVRTCDTLFTASIHTAILDFRDIYVYEYIQKLLEKKQK